ncbi:MAG TPA: SDR family NAD(P)-dependent oxidoreductase [Planctomycetota bacterium]|nr:SDR family NAD(P)-dependent oxidoreductase [Planctomycetota bacterium]
MVLENKVIVVAGVGEGLGREVARLALRDGARVVVAARNAEKLAKIAHELDPDGKRIAARSTDILDLASCEGLAEEAVQRFGGVDAVVNVAALDTLFGTLETTSDEDWKRAFETNVVGTLHVVRAAAPHMRKRGGGSVVLVGSRSQWFPPDNHQIAYASSKGALLSAMYHLVHELGPDRIRVNMVVPTWMWGPPVQLYVKWQAGQRKISEQAVIDEITAGMPLASGIPADEDVAEAIVFFCSDRSRMITGETLQVHAGELLR